MSSQSALGSAPRARQLAKLGISISQAAVSKYMIHHRRPPSQTWRSFLDNHVKDLVSVDFFTLPTATFRVLFVFIVLRHDRRRILHFNVTEHPPAEWSAQQIVDAFPWDSAPRFMLRDRDGIYGAYFKRRVVGLGIQQVLTAPDVMSFSRKARRSCAGSRFRDAATPTEAFNARELAPRVESSLRIADRVYGRHTRIR